MSPLFREYGCPIVVSNGIPREVHLARVVDHFEQTRQRDFPTWQGPCNVVWEQQDIYLVVGWRDDIPEEAFQ